MTPEPHKERTMEKKISLTVNDNELHFNVSLADYNKYINELTPSNKVARPVIFSCAVLMSRAGKPCATLSTSPALVCR